MGQQSPHTQTGLLASRGHMASNLKPILPPGLTQEEGRPHRAATLAFPRDCGLPPWLGDGVGGPAANPAPQAPGPIHPLRWGEQSSRLPRDNPRGHLTHSRVKTRCWATGSLLASCHSGPINTGNYISPLLLLGSQKYELSLPALAVSNNSSSPW